MIAARLPGTCSRSAKLQSVRVAVDDRDRSTDADADLDLHAHELAQHELRPVRDLGGLVDTFLAADAQCRHGPLRPRSGPVQDPRGCDAVGRSELMEQKSLSTWRDTGILHRREEGAEGSAVALAHGDWAERPCSAGASRAATTRTGRLGSLPETSESHARGNRRIDLASVLDDGSARAENVVVAWLRDRGGFGRTWLPAGAGSARSWVRRPGNVTSHRFGGAAGVFRGVF